MDYYYIFYSFIIYSFLGWTLEVVYHLYTEKRFINRGFLYGPVCPIYGATAVLLILVLSSISSNMLYIFIGGALAATLIELITGFLMELFFHTKWWDYSDEKFNVKGYICLKFSILWGFLSIIFMKIINPVVSKFTYLLLDNFGQILYNVFLIIIIVDIALTINSLITFRKLFMEIQDVMLETKANMDKLIESKLSKETILSIQERISHLGDIKDRLAKRVSLRHTEMIRAYPHLTSERFGGAIEEIKKRIEKINIKK
ncbi:hypothetical protein HMPREF1982_02836 [Clostridiales bacterium oral taxon 876 str. F0540]|nr:hypothetical protein HMPREF1982_02836 [Clostridiales bacterium oral taxon 876 str. F0540]